MKKLGNLMSMVLLIVMLAIQSIAPSVALAHDDDHHDNFVRRDGSKLTLNGKEFRFGGTNNYYLMYKSQFMVDDVLDKAAAQGYKVLRTWGNLEIGNQDGSNSTNGKSDGVYFQYWDGNAPAYNDGADGMLRLDYIIYKAGQKGLKLVIPFTNNWNAFGSADQYVRWANKPYHDQFYSDAQIKGWFKNWISHVLNRVNTYTGIAYKNDPTIMTWELANEPRCKQTDQYPTSGTCTTQTLIKWADEMSTYTKKLDKNHLVSVGDEGFYCTPGATDWTENCGEGVDVIAFTKLKNIDVMSYHLYPELWGKDIPWTINWIERHAKDAKKLGKAVMAGEFGVTDQNTRNATYKLWGDTILKTSTNGGLFWMLAGTMDTGLPYPDYDGHNIYCPGAECTTLSHFAAMMKADHLLQFAPVAGSDKATTEANTAVNINLSPNDISYGKATLVPGSVDLDATTAGIQTTASAYGGTYTTQADGSVTFTPTAGFNGKSQASYTIKDSQGKTSNVATITVTVKPDPAGATTLYSFEFGLDGWGPASWEPHGTVAQDTASATEGTHSLKIISTGGWFTVEPSPILDISSGGQYIRFEMNSSIDTSTKFAFSTGDTWAWQESAPITLNVGDNIVGADLLNGINGGALVDANKIRRIALYLAPGTYYMDNMRLDHVAPPPPPTPSSDVLLYSFESDTQGWAPVSWDPQGSTSQSASFHTEGAKSLQIDTTGSGWFGLGLPVAADFTGKTNLKFDLQTGAVGTSLSVVLQTGSGWTWCQSPWTWVDAGATTAVDIDLSTLADTSSNPCSIADLNQVHAIYVFLNGGGSFNIDNVRVAGAAVVTPAALFSFESDAQGWGPASWDPHGTVAQTGDFHTDGSKGLQIVTTGDGWYGVDFPASANFTGKTHLKFDIQTLAAGTSMSVAIKIGSGWTWCQGSWGWVNAGTTSVVDLDLTTLTDASSTPCNIADLNEVHSIYFFLNGGGTFNIDNVRVQ